MDKESVRCYAHCLELVNNGRLSLRVEDRKDEFLFDYDYSNDAVRFGPANESNKVFYHSQYLGGVHIITFHVFNKHDGRVALPGLRKELRIYEIEHVSDLDRLRNRHRERLDRRESWANTEETVHAYGSLVKNLMEEKFG